MVGCCFLLATIIGFATIRDLDKIDKWTNVLGFFIALVSLLASLTRGNHCANGAGGDRFLDRVSDGESVPDQRDAED